MTSLTNIYSIYMWNSMFHIYIYNTQQPDIYNLSTLTIVILNQLCRQPHTPTVLTIVIMCSCGPSRLAWMAQPEAGGLVQRDAHSWGLTALGRSGRWLGTSWGTGRFSFPAHQLFFSSLTNFQGTHTNERFQGTRLLRDSEAKGGSEWKESSGRFSVQDCPEIGRF